VANGGREGRPGDLIDAMMGVSFLPHPTNLLSVSMVAWSRNGTIGIIAVAVIGVLLLIAVLSPSKPDKPAGVIDLQESHIVVAGVSYIEAVGHINPGKMLYYYTEGEKSSSLDPVFVGTIVGFTAGEDTITIRHSDGLTGTIRRDVIRYQRMYWVRE
jgi:hypothetical protein